MKHPISEFCSKNCKWLALTGQPKCYLYKTELIKGQQYDKCKRSSMCVKTRGAKPK